MIVGENRRGVVQQLFSAKPPISQFERLGLAGEPQFLADLLEVGHVAVGRLLHESSVGVIRIVARGELLSRHAVIEVSCAAPRSQSS